MTGQLIKQDNHYIVVSDEEIKEGEYYYDEISCEIYQYLFNEQMYNRKKVICTSSKEQAIDMDLFYFEVESLKKEPKSIELNIVGVDDKDSQDIILKSEPQHTTESKLKRLTNYKINF